jgi:hypothetical protein
MDLSESEQQVYDQQANAIKNNVIYHVFIKWRQISFHEMLCVGSYK